MHCRGQSGVLNLFIIIYLWSINERKTKYHNSANVAQTDSTGKCKSYN